MFFCNHSNSYCQTMWNHSSWAEESVNSSLFMNIETDLSGLEGLQVLSDWSLEASGDPNVLFFGHTLTFCIFWSLISSFVLMTKTSCSVFGLMFELQYFCQSLDVNRSRGFVWTWTWLRPGGSEEQSKRFDCWIVSWNQIYFICLGLPVAA